MRHTLSVRTASARPTPTLLESLEGRRLFAAAAFVYPSSVEGVEFHLLSTTNDTYVDVSLSALNIRTNGNVFPHNRPFLYGTVFLYDGTNNVTIEGSAPADTPLADVGINPDATAGHATGGFTVGQGVGSVSFDLSFVGVGENGVSPTRIREHTAGGLFHYTSSGGQRTAASTGQSFMPDAIRAELPLTISTVSPTPASTVSTATR